MTSSTLGQPGSAVGVRPGTRAGDAAYVLALASPLALFVHGILRWVDGLGRHVDGPFGGPPVPGPLETTAGVVLVVAVSGFAWLTAALARRVEHLLVGVPPALLAAFGAGATGAVWVGRTVGVLDESIPTALSVGGPVLVGVSLAVVLGALTIEDRMPPGSFALALTSAAVLALPWDLIPLGALLTLIAFGPLMRLGHSPRISPS